MLVVGRGEWAGQVIQFLTVFERNWCSIDNF